MSTGRRQARRTALFLLYQWDLTGQPLTALYEGVPDPFALDLAETVSARAEQLDRRLGVLLRREPLQLVTSRLQPFEQLLGAPERLVRGSGLAHATSSLATRARIPFTSRAASSDAYRFASTTASFIATSGGTLSSSSS